MALSGDAVRRARPHRLLVLGAALVLAAACTSGNGNGGGSSGGQANKNAPAASDLAGDQTLRIDPYGSFIRSFDPNQQNFDNALARIYTETLLKPVPDKDDVTGAAAERYDVSSDGLTYTFHLRADGRYSDGQPVRAADFVYAWTRVIDPRLAAPARAALAGVVKGGRELAALDPKSPAETLDAADANLGLKAPDERTFQVTLPHPLPEFKWIATQGVGAPVRRDLVERYGADKWATSPDSLITNGPFKVSQIVPGQSITWVPNPQYREKPVLTKIVSTQQDTQPAWTSYLNGELDVSNGPPDGTFDGVLKDPATAKQVVSYPVLALGWVPFNTKAAPFDNAKVRLAFAQAVDRDALTKAIGPTRSSGGNPYSALLPAGLPGANPDAGSAQRYDLTAAKATLASSGVDPAALRGIHLLASQFSQRDAQLFQSQIKDHLGIDMTLDVIGDFSTLQSMLRQGRFQLYGPVYGHQAVYPGPGDFADVFVSTANNPENPTGWQDPQYDQLVSQAQDTVDPAKRLQLFDQAQRIVVQQAPVAILSQIQNYVLVKPWVKGLVRTSHDDTFLPGDFYLSKTYIAKH